MAHFDRFDIAEAHYLWMTEHHEGQDSDWYLRLCKMSLFFKPRPSLSLSTLTENGKEIYLNLCLKYGCTHDLSELP